ncbi:MBL fold metallo-hydrolase RNA specificity domain-containing protein [Planctomycetota bacterium]
MIKLQFNCAVRNVTGSRHILEIDGRRLLLDCGMFQGPRKLSRERNNTFHFESSSIQNCVLSHAHIDHSGTLPALVRKKFQGEIFCTPATADLADILLHDSAHIQMYDAEYINKKRRKKGDTPVTPLYTEKDVEETLKRIKTVPYGQAFEPAAGVRATFFDAGHILGSAVTLYEISDGDRKLRLGFTGDLGRKSMPILKDPQHIPDLDVLITESTYGQREHPESNTMRDELCQIINRVHKRKGRLIIPAFSVGRSQTILYYIHQLLNKKKIPRQQVFLDSPLAIAATRIVSKHSECFDRSALKLAGFQYDNMFNIPNLDFTKKVNDSIAINRYPDPCIIISASGMCEAGRILHHLKNNISGSHNAVLIVGWQAPHTLGRRIVERQDPLRIFDRKYPLKAEVIKINGLSAHADGAELTEWAASAVKPEGKIFCIHGELDACEALAGRLRKREFNNVHVPEDHEWVEI